ncbi:MAG: hypothetical protein QG593_539 [Patescibacteria group bacterium]|nr:hypothetical protein [Patescibacteria group bacterium]
MNASDIYGDGKRPEYLQKETEGRPVSYPGL